MSELTFIGLANYTLGTTTFATIIFTSDTNSQTSYVYQFSTSSSPNNIWVPISILTNVSIIANTEINIQLTIPSTIEGNYYLFIKSTITNTIIWQQSNSYYGRASLKTLVGTISSILSNQASLPIQGGTNSSTLSSQNSLTKPVGTNVTTLSGGYILNNINITTGTLDNYITTSNTLLTVPTINFNPTFDISDTSSNSQSAPLFIIGYAGILITDNLTTMSGSINIIGINTKGVGISIPNAININGNFTFNGIGISGIVLNNTITCYGNTIFNGITTSGDSLNDAGIVLNNNIINNGQYNIILNGGTTLYNTSGKGIYNKPGNISNDNVTLYPNYSPQNGVTSSFIPYIIVSTSPIKKIKTWQIVLIVILVLLLILGIILAIVFK